MNPAEFANIAAAEEGMWWYRGMRAITAALLGGSRPLRGSALLEAGCGTGYNARWLEREFGARVVAIDLSPSALGQARRRGVARAAAADVKLLPFPDGVFDVATCFDVLVHLAPGEEAPAFRELARVLRPGGLLLLRVAAFNWLRSRHSEFIAERQRFTASSVQRLLREAGLRTLRCSYANTLLLPVALGKFRLWEPLFQPRPASGVETPAEPLNRLLLSALEAEAAWLKRGHRLPVGQSFLALAEKQS
jgi:SAM-dependent methyltransferase